ncbi:MAG: OmpA family protein [Candidatus Sumerlaeota bacterium]|nr:OmpA family protein [Candidatus Sumerlaeota bacterium]
MFAFKSVRLLLLAMAAMAVMAAAGCLTAMSDLRQINEEQTRRITELEKNHEEYTNSYYNLKKEKEKLDAQYSQEMEAKKQEIARLTRLHSEQLSEAEKAKIEISSRYKDQLEQGATSELSLKQRVADLEKNKKDLDAELADAKKSRDELGAQLKTSQTDMEKTKLDLDRATSKVADLEEKTAKLLTDLGAAQAATEADRKKLAELSDKASQINALDESGKKMLEENKNLKDMNEGWKRALGLKEENERALKRSLANLSGILKSGAAPGAIVQQTQEWLAQTQGAASKAAAVMPPDKNMPKLYEAALEDLKGEIAKNNLAVDRDARGVVIRIPVHLFESLTVVRPEAKKTLEAVAALAAKFPEYSIMIEGHTDSEKVVRAAFFDNLELSMQRAINVYRKMIEEIEPRISPARVRAVGCGEFHPIADNSTAEGKSKNRRVEFVFTPLY